VLADCLVINPKQPGCEYPFKQLAGVGVAFKVAQAIQKKTNMPKSAIMEVLDFVAVGTIGDVVPLIDENRTLVKYGMKELNSLNRKGMRCLVEKTCPKSSLITSENVAFIIVPHINAVGRMLNADAAVELLITDDDDTIKENVEKLIDSNNRRKQIQDEVYEQCVQIVDKHLSNKRFLMICALDAHEGIAGIVAGKIKSKYNKPAIIITKSEDIYKGTGRSLENINMYELLNNFSDLFVKFGGHSGACGFTMKYDDLCTLKDGLQEKTNELYDLDPGLFDENFSFDMEIRGQDITVDLGELLECLAPFGNQNKKPFFLVRGVKAKEAAMLGEDGKHMRFAGHCPDGKILQCVLFNNAKEYQEIVFAGQSVSILGNLEVQVWNGNKKVQFIVDKIMEKNHDS
jgi:single-stranded-DNA-specific exonuclease